MAMVVSFRHAPMHSSVHAQPLVHLMCELVQAISHVVLRLHALLQVRCSASHALLQAALLPQPWWHDVADS
jgi:hypothetical protein